MNQVSASKRFSKPLALGVLLGVTALALSGGCNSQSNELQAMDAKALAGPPPPKPAMPGAVAAPMQPGSIPPGMQTGSPGGSPGAAVSPIAATVPSVVAAAPPVAAAPVSAAAPTAVPVAAPTAAPQAPYSNAASSGKSKVSMVMATPAGAAPRLVPGTMALKAQFKQLWNKGASAKHRGDIAGARRAWLAARRLAPQWPGFQESLDKLS